MSARIAQPVVVVEANGTRGSLTLSADEHVALFAEVVHSGQAGLVEFVAARRLSDGSLRMRSRRNSSNYVPAGDAAALVALARRARARREEAFATPLARTVAEPGKRAVRGGSALWVDVDGVEESAAIELADELRPHLVVASGGGIHCYWRLSHPVTAGAIEQLNRRLCHRLKGDAACTDCGRIMRLPGTWNGKRGRWARVIRVDRERPPVNVERLRARLPDPEPDRPARRLSRQFNAELDPLAELAPPAYFRALAGVEVPERGGYIHCPLPGHTEQTASCRVWPERERGWWCFGCGRGGGAAELAGLLPVAPQTDSRDAQESADPSAAAARVAR